jgi:hypothetical protein
MTRRASRGHMYGPLSATARGRHREQRNEKIQQMYLRYMHRHRRRTHLNLWIVIKKWPLLLPTNNCSEGLAEPWPGPGHGVNCHSTKHCHGVLLCGRLSTNSLLETCTSFKLRLAELCGKDPTSHSCALYVFKNFTAFAGHAAGWSQTTTALHPVP